jgi:hypothetical protein
VKGTRSRQSMEEKAAPAGRALSSADAGSRRA